MIRTTDLDGPLQSHIATTYGITTNSILNTSRYFHVVDGLVPDIMHDILEGTVQVTLKCLLWYLIQEGKKFSLTTLNERIGSFNYGLADVQNRPSEIPKTSFFSSSDTLRQSGISIALKVMCVNVMTCHNSFTDVVFSPIYSLACGRSCSRK